MQTSQSIQKSILDSIIQELTEKSEGKRTDTPLIINYTKRGCKKCINKGYYEYKPLGYNQFHTQICPCVLRNIKLEAEQIVS